MWRSASDSAMKPVSNQNPAYITSSVDFEDPISYPNIYPIKTGGKGNTPISRQTTAPEVVSCLVKRGCQDLTANIEIFTFDPIAPGGFSDVYRGKMVGHESKLVAVKVPRISAENFGESPEHISNSARELHTWSKCNHPNVLPLLGLMNFRGRIAMVSPWMDGGNLPRYLETNPGADWPDLCIQVCEGLSHLHEIGIIHGDLKGSNILVSRGGIPVLIDFGNSILKNRTLKFTESTNGSAFTLGWSAPEFFKKNGICQCTKATDVYALGMTIYEVIAGKRPYDGIAFPGVIKLVSEKTPPERPTCIPPGHENGDMLWELLRHCWSYEPEARPSAAEVTAAMKTITLAGVRFQPRQRPTSSYEPETDIGIE
ncbi:kinase-like domain-containing protein [Rhizoctonia solani]|nr:kinase-like domain-containing protein [Rhizoctonia solani]